MGVIGGVCSLAGYVPYARKIIKGKSVPKRASWFVWTLSGGLMVLSYWQLGARTTIWVPLAYVIGSAFITILAYTHGKPGWGVLDKVALVAAIISSARWIYFDQPIVALVLTVTIGLVSYIPNIINLFKNKVKSQDLNLEDWTLFFLGSLLNLIAISSWRPVISIIPILLFIMNGITFGLSLRNSLSQEKSPFNTQ
jgi:hypothetical protein